jgi:hypothetical protein
MGDRKQRAYRSARREVYYKLAVCVAVSLLLGWLYQGDDADTWAPWVVADLAGVGLIALALMVRRTR